MSPAAIEPPPRTAPARFSLAPFKSRASIAACTVVALGLAAEWLQPLAPLAIFHARPSGEAPQRAQLEPSSVVGEAKITSQTETRTELAQPDSAELKAAQAELLGARRAGDFALPAIDAAAPPLPLADPTGKALTGFFRALSATARKQPHAITRIAHFGDSIVV